MKKVKVSIIAIIKAIGILHHHLKHRHRHNLSHLRHHLRGESINKKKEIKKYLNRDLLIDTAARVNNKANPIIKASNKK